MSHTRHLTAVVRDGKIAHAQYGQYDGYPSGAGLVAKHAITNPLVLVLLVQNLPTIRQCTGEIWQQLWVEHAGGLPTEKTTQAVADAFFAKYPAFNDKMGAGWLAYVAENPNAYVATNMAEFAADGVLCEWAWVLNLDTAKLEVYEGGRVTPGDYGVFAEVVETYFDLAANTTDGGRTYFPCQKIIEFDFASLAQTTDAEFEERVMAARSVTAPRELDGTPLEVATTSCGGSFRWKYFPPGERDPRLYLEIGDEGDPDFNSVNFTPVLAQKWVRQLVAAVALSVSDKAIDVARQVASEAFRQECAALTIRNPMVMKHGSMPPVEALAAAWRAGMRAAFAFEEPERPLTPPVVPVDPIERLRTLRARARDLADDLTSWIDATCEHNDRESAPWRATRAAESEARDIIGSLDAALEMLSQGYMTVPVAKNPEE